MNIWLENFWPSQLRSGRSVLDLIIITPFTGGTALMQAHILISVEFALPMKHADLASRIANNAAFAVGNCVALATNTSGMWSVPE